MLLCELAVVWLALLFYCRGLNSLNEYEGRTVFNCSYKVLLLLICGIVIFIYIFIRYPVELILWLVGVSIVLACASVIYKPNSGMKSLTKP